MAPPLVNGRGTHGYSSHSEPTSTHAGSSLIFWSPPEVVTMTRQTMVDIKMITPPGPHDRIPSFNIEGARHRKMVRATDLRLWARPVHRAFYTARHR